MPWPFDPKKVLADPALSPGTKSDIQSGQSIIDAAKNFATSSSDIGRALHTGANKILAPATSLGPPALRGVKATGKYIGNSPNLAKALIGGAVLAPILGSSFSQNQNAEENQLMSTRLHPERDVTASLDTFLEKKAAAPRPQFANTPSEYGTHFGKGIRGSGMDLGKGLAMGAGQQLGKAVLGLLTSAFDVGNEAMFTKPKQKAILDTALRTDPVIADFINGHPEHLSMLKDAYATLSRFAPSLSTDINVVRTYLREVALSGGGVNYATVKNLIDTERALIGKEGHI